MKYKRAKQNIKKKEKKKTSSHVNFYFFFFLIEKVRMKHDKTVPWYELQNHYEIKMTASSVTKVKWEDLEDPI